jgi:hypothetical protein
MHDANSPQLYQESHAIMWFVKYATDNGPTEEYQTHLTNYFDA